MRILIADNQMKVRYALSVLLQEHPGWQIAGCIADARELLDRLGSLAPDVLLLDWKLPGMGRLELLHCIRHTRASLVVIAMSTNPEARHEAQAQGYDYFVSKVDSPHKLLEVIAECEKRITKD
jgi:DNA-binding NarL/FixJ family response regulator